MPEAAAVRHNVRLVDTGSDADLHAALMAVDPAAGDLAMRRGVMSAVLLEDLAIDQARVVARVAARGGALAVPNPEGNRCLVLGPRNAVAGIPAGLRAFSDQPRIVDLARTLEAGLLAAVQPPAPLRLGPHTWAFGRRTYVLGILNVTPDSFSGDGVGDDLARVQARAEALVAAGADALDVGGESTRPGHEPVPVAEELRRVVPAVRALAPALGVPISVDTSKAAVARAALEAGAVCINDVWGLRRDPEMASVAAAADAAVICMHNQAGTEYQDLVGDVLRDLRRSLEVAGAAGLSADRCVVDPGFGFGKDATQNLALLRRLRDLRVLGRPLLVGTSRKSTIGRILGGRPATERLHGTAATVALAIAAGADIVRVHDVAAMRDVSRVTDAVVRGRPLDPTPG